jgi:hypothetical protein
MLFAYQNAHSPLIHRGANFYNNLRKTAALVWQRFVDVRDAAVPLVAYQIKNLKPPAQAYFHAAAHKVVANEKKPDTRVPSTPAVAAVKGAKVKGGAVVLAVRAFSNAMKSACNKAMRSSFGGFSEDDDDGYSYYLYNLSVSRLAGFQPKP